MAESTCTLTVTVDLSFDELMIDKDIAKLTKQILRCYTLNRRATAPMQFSLTSFTGKSRTSMEKHNGYKHWDVSFHTEPYINIYPKDKIIYLTSESNNVIDRLEHDCVYVIGGLVDHNAHKGMCHKLAIETGVRHGRLPLDRFLQMKARKVLTIDHVFEILLRVSEGDTWQKAFLKVLPERKNARPIISVQSKEDESQDLKPIDVNNAVLVDIGNSVSVDLKSSDVNNTMPVDVNNAVPFDIGNIVPISSKPVDVNNTMPVDVNNTVPIAVNNTLTVIKDNDIKLECKTNSKEILNESSCIT